MRLAVLMLLVPMTALSQTKRGDMPLAAAQTKILADHLRVSLPVGMKVEARGHSIMAAPAADEDETRAVMDSGKARFVLMAHELYAFIPPDLRTGVAALASRQGLDSAKLEDLGLTKPLSGFAMSVPTKGDGDANLVEVAWVANADGTVQLLAFYVNPAGEKDAATWATLARRVAASLKPGTRTLASEASVHTLSAGPESLQVSLPDAWVHTTQPGPDFFVYRIRKMLPLGAPDCTCGIYLGNHGAYQHTQMEIADAKVTTVPGRVFGANVSWHVWSKDGTTWNEAMAKHPKSSATVHVFCSANTATELAELRQIVETLKVDGP